MRDRQYEAMIKGSSLDMIHSLVDELVIGYSENASECGNIFGNIARMFPKCEICITFRTFLL